MKKITEFLETLFSTANQRIKSPFFGSFIFSWIIINWKPIFYFLFSDDKISLKIKNIEESYEFIQNSILYPLLLSFIYVVVFPYINQFIHWLTIKAENSKRIEHHKLKIEQIKNSYEIAEGEKRLEDIISGNYDISQLNDKISMLEKENVRLNKTIKNKDKTISDYGEKLDNVIDEKQKIEKEYIFIKNNEEIIKDLEFSKFKENYYFNQFSEIAERIKKNKNIFNSDMDFIKQYLNYGVVNKNSEGNYQLTIKGNEYLDYLKNIN